MFSNAKNVMFDIDKVRTEILRSHGEVPDLEKALHCGEDSIPIGFYLPIGCIEFEKDKDEELDPDHFPVTPKGIYIYAVQTMSTMKYGEYGVSLLSYINDIENEAAKAGAYKNSNRIKLSRILEKVYPPKDEDTEDNEVFNFDIDKENKRISDELDKLMHPELKEWELYVNVVGLEIEDTEGQDYARLKAEIDFCVKHIDLINELLSKFRSQEDVYQNLMLCYSSIHQVLAINVIKLVEKGTDTAENFYTGNTRAIVYEALAQSDMNYPDGYKISTVNIYKTIEGEKADNKSHILPVFAQRLRETSSVLKIANIKYPVMTTIRCVPYKQEGSKYNGLFTHESKQNNKYSVIDGENVIITANKTMSHYLGFTDTRFGVQSLVMSRLFIPNGYDLTNSFKAKYI